MKLEAPCEPDVLVALGEEAVALLCRGDLDTLARRYGYALSFGRDPARAIRDDLTRSLSEVGATSLASAPPACSTSVKYFQPDGSNLRAVIECLVPTANGAELLVELVVSSTGEEKHVTLEQISAVDQPIDSGDAAS